MQLGGPRSYCCKTFSGMGVCGQKRYKEETVTHIHLSHPTQTKVTPNSPMLDL